MSGILHLFKNYIIRAHKQQRAVQPYLPFY